MAKRQVILRSAADIWNESLAKRAAAMGDTLDTKELFHLIDQASGNFAWAVDALYDASALFEAIRCATSENSLAHRLASLGIRSCDEHAGGFEGQRDEYNEQARRFAPQFGILAAEAT